MRYPPNIVGEWGYEHAGELALVITFDELDAFALGMMPNLSRPPSSRFHDMAMMRPLGEINVAPMLAFARSAEVRRSP